MKTGRTATLDIALALFWTLVMVAPMAGLLGSYYMWGQTGIFYALALLAVAPGLMIMVSQDIVRAAFFLMLSLSSFAGFYVLLGADFLALIQVLVYLGGIMILILFGVMLTARDPVFVARQRSVHLVLPGLFAGLLVVASVSYVVIEAFENRNMIQTAQGSVTAATPTCLHARSVIRDRLRGGTKTSAVTGDGAILVVPAGAVDGAGTVTLSGASDLMTVSSGQIGPALKVGFEGEVHLVSSATLLLPIQVKSFSPTVKPSASDAELTVSIKGPDGEVEERPAGRPLVVVEADDIGRFVVAVPALLIAKSPLEEPVVTAEAEATVSVTVAAGGTLVLDETFADATLRGAVISVPAEAVSADTTLMVKSMPGLGSTSNLDSLRGEVLEPHMALASGLEVSLGEGELLLPLRMALPYQTGRLASNVARREIVVQHLASNLAHRPMAHAVSVVVRSPGIYQPTAAYSYTSAAVGFLFLTDFILPFEIASVLLLVALVGAAYIARKHQAN